VTICQGKALALVRLVPRHDGVRAWPSLAHEYEPDEASRRCAVLAGLMSPEWRSDAPFADQLLSWENDGDGVRGSDGVDRSGQIPVCHICIVMKWAPPKVQEFLRLTPEDLTRDYGRLRSAFQTYLARGRTYDAAGCLRGADGSLPMEVDALKSKGKRKQPTPATQQQRTCFNCGRIGHVRADCRSPTVSGKGGRGGGKGGKGEQMQKCGKRGRAGHRAADCRSGGKGSKGGGKSAQPGAAKTQFTGICFKRGTPGHRASDCRRVLALQVEGYPEEAPVMSIAPMEPWLLSVDDQMRSLHRRYSWWTRERTPTCARRSSRQAPR